VDRQSLTRRQDSAALAGGAETQSRAGAARQDPRQPSRFLREPAVTDGIDASQQGVEVSSSHPKRNRRSGNADVQQLAPRHDPVLARRELGDGEGQWA
jgi:hypothetical protein